MSVVRRSGLAVLFACLLARCLFPSLDGLSGGGDASVTNEAGPIAFVQQRSTDVLSTDASVAIPGAVGAGNTLVVCSDYPVDFGSMSVSDTLGRTYALLGSADGANSGSGHNVCFVSIGGLGGPDTITFTLTSTTLADGSADDLEAYVLEYQNVAAVDQKLATFGVDDSGPDAFVPWDAGSITAASPNELLFAWVEGSAAARLDSTFTSRTMLNGNDVGDQILDASGAFLVTGTANANWTLVAATFKGL